LFPFLLISITFSSCGLAECCWYSRSIEAREMSALGH
jgi:hypothetical protein